MATLEFLIISSLNLYFVNAVQWHSGRPRCWGLGASIHRRPASGCLATSLGGIPGGWLPCLPPVTTAPFCPLPLEGAWVRAQEESGLRARALPILVGDRAVATAAPGLQCPGSSGGPRGRDRLRIGLTSEIISGGFAASSFPRSQRDEVPSLCEEASWAWMPITSIHSSLARTQSQGHISLQGGKKL